MSITSRHTEQVFKDLLAQKEKIIFGQLGNLLKDGILSIVETEPVIIQSPTDNVLKLEQAVRLTFNGEEVLEVYRKKVDELTKDLKTIHDFVNKQETRWKK